MKEKQTLPEKLGNLITIAANAVMMNVLFLVACIPVVTIGAAWNGLFSAIRFNIRGEKWFDGFKVGYKTRFWRSLIAWTLLLIPILIVLQVDVIGALAVEGGGIRGWDTFTVDQLVRLVFACVMGLMLTGLGGVLMLLNVYIPTSVSNWIRNAANMLFKVPLQVAATGLLIWAPFLILQLWTSIFYFFVMIFVVVYFLLAALGITILMKNPLIDCLVEAREEGTLLSDKAAEDLEETEDGKVEEKEV